MTKEAADVFLSATEAIEIAQAAAEAVRTAA
jgi:hypothetical protein